jgi:general nucleoside transport system permease protein
MDFGGINPVILIATLMASAVPILLAALGETVVERSGVLNLGVEGMMVIGALGGFVVAVWAAEPTCPGWLAALPGRGLGLCGLGAWAGNWIAPSFLGFVGGSVCGAAFSLIFALLTQVFLANQVATGLALTLFGYGVSSLAGQGYNGIKPPATGQLLPDFLADLPVLGPIVFGHDWVVYFSIAMVAVLWWVLKSTRMGLIIRAVGESHEAAHALGYKVNRIRLGCIAFGGAMAGMGGAYLSLVRVPQWVDGITAGAGWIALAIVVFASWRPWRVLIGAYLFGGITVLQLNLQVAGSQFPLWLLPVLVLLGILADNLVRLFSRREVTDRRKVVYVFGAASALLVLYLAWGIWVPLPVEYLSMAPYLMTILVLVIMSAGRKAYGAPAALAQNFHASR